jgi:acetyl esterase/lipase
MIMSVKLLSRNATAGGALATLFAASALFAQPKIPDTVEVTRNVEYCQGGGHPLLLDVYRPKERAAVPAPAMLWIHGGGWRAGDKEPAPLALQLATRGFVTASANYRLSGEAPFPAAIEDCKCAVRFLRANAARYGIDPARIGVAGGSAGGHLALLVGTADESAGLEGTGGWKGVSSRVAAVLSWFGPADFSVGHEAFEKGRGPSIAAFLGGALNEKPENYRRASPVTWVSKDDPPLLLIHGNADSTVPFDQSIRMEKAYRKAGLAVELIKVENAEHGFKAAGSAPATPDLQEIMRRSGSFFEQCFGK